MSHYRDRHKIAVEALENAKDKADSYTLPPRTIMFKKIDKNGRVYVGIKNFDQGQFRAIKMSHVVAMGINVDLLPEYTEFSKTYYEKMIPAKEYFNEARAKSRQEVMRARYEALRPYYQARREIYDDYMASAEWQQKRKDVFDAQGEYCIDCGSDATDIHHLHYESLGDECPLLDLVPLCRRCHEIRHDIETIEP